jgi:hypothetical protein
MVKIYETNKIELYLIVFFIYGLDIDYIKKIHKLDVDESLSDIDKLKLYVEDTMSSISEFESIYKLVKDDSVIGFFTLNNLSNYETQLNGFHISEKYRTKDVLQEFWRFIYSKSNEYLICGLYEKNEKAISHLKNNNFVKNSKIYFGKYNKNFTILTKKIK